ncbi:MAG TPA: FKBP-type peptidyl-prolyl cis-trans isomerase [Solirubrobacterales bacterium]
MRTVILAIGAAAAIAFAGCGDDDSTTSEGDTTVAEATAPQTKPDVEPPKGAPPKQLEVEDLIQGSGEVAESGDGVTVQYVGVNYRSGKEFDASWGREPFSFQLGAGMVIPGWDQGVEGMKVGGRRELIIPPNLGYGPAGTPDGSIPPNETLVFVVDLLEVE